MPDDLDDIIKARTDAAVAPLLRRIEDLEGAARDTDGQAMLDFYGTFFPALSVVNDRAAYLRRLAEAAAVRGDEVDV